MSFLIASVVTVPALAQDGPPPMFQPPSPPPLDAPGEFDELEEDTMELGDESYRPPPPTIPIAPTQSPNPGDFRPTGGSGNFGGSGTNQPAKLRFQIVEGEFWEKGKKRGRGQKIR